jgi:hypothetical protein
MEVHENEKLIIELKKHIVRTEWSNKERQSIINDLKVNEGLLTMDFAMKWLPLKARERSKDWYGKKGISWHVGHVISARNWGLALKLMHHTFIHIVNTESKLIL